jgi:Tol biopolymer transport system component
MVPSLSLNFHVRRRESSRDQEIDVEPDSIRIAFISDGPPERSDVYAMNADDSGPTEVTDDSAVDSFPAWRPSKSARNREGEISE